MSNPISQKLRTWRCQVLLRPASSTWQYPRFSTIHCGTSWTKKLNHLWLPRGVCRVSHEVTTHIVDKLTDKSAYPTTKTTKTLPIGATTAPSVHTTHICLQTTTMTQSDNLECSTLKEESEEKKNILIIILEIRMQSSTVGTPHRKKGRSARRHSQRDGPEWHKTTKIRLFQSRIT